MTAHESQTIVGRLTLVLLPLLWCVGFLGSLFLGCGVELAILKATAFALSGLAGWGLFRLFWKANLPHLIGPWIGLFGMNVSLLNPTRTPWPFPNMLAHGLFTCCSVALITGLLFRLMLGNRKNICTLIPNTEVAESGDR